MKLNNDIRHDLVNRLLSHRFEKPSLEYSKKWEDFATEVYDKSFTKDEKTWILNLPDGWLPKEDRISVIFGSEFTMVYFSMNPVIGPCKPCIRKPMPDKYTQTSRVQFAPTNPIVKKHDNLCREINEFKALVRNTKKELEVTFSSVATTKALLDAWPEMKPFLEDYVPAMTTALVIPVKHLNKTLGLPVGI